MSAGSVSAGFLVCLLLACSVVNINGRGLRLGKLHGSRDQANTLLDLLDFKPMLPVSECCGEGMKEIGDFVMCEGQCCQGLEEKAVTAPGLGFTLSCIQQVLQPRPSNIMEHSAFSDDMVPLYQGGFAKRSIGGRRI